MSQNTTTQNILKIAITVIVIQLIATSAYADGTCLLNRSDIADDMEKINEKLAVKYPNSGFQNSSHEANDINQIYDEQQLKVDRSDKLLKQVDAVGIVTGLPLASATESGSAVMISPCHVLISAHSVDSDNARYGKSPVYISVGQNTCDLQNEFLHQDVEGQVITMGDYSIKNRSSHR